MGAIRKKLDTPKESGIAYEDWIIVRDPVSLPERISCTRIPVGITGDYKPCVAVLPNGDILLVAFYPDVPFGEGRYREDIIMYRSSDGGKTWSDRLFPPILGREPYMSVLRNGSILLTTHFLADDVRNPEGYCHSYVYRSTDFGATWCARKITYDQVPGSPKKEENCSSRNVLELRDGTLIFGMSSLTSPKSLWKSKDKGSSWLPPAICKFPGIDESSVSMWETVFWRARNDDIIGLFRVDSSRFRSSNRGGPVPPSGSDQYHFLVAFRSRDGGVTWMFYKEIGNAYGEMYPSIIRLKDRRILLTTSQRGFPPLGVRAVLGKELVDGFEFNADSDMIMLDTRTPEDQSQGGGFGNTVQLPDSSLLTPYSYRGSDGKTRMEAVKWLPPPVRPRRR